MPPTGIPLPKLKGAATAPGPVGSPAYNAAYGAAFQNDFSRAQIQATGPMDPSKPLTQIGPGTFQSPTQYHTLQDILAGNVPGVGATVTGSPATPDQLAQLSNLGLQQPQGTNLGAYAVTPDQYQNPTPNPALSYLGLPNYGGGGGGDNSDNGFAALFGAQNQPNFLSGWT